ncbi:cell division protein SepF [Actinospica durhamensis]|uniref:Cell division protein SepF n=1 Tax=Actinospica durhamensis TaxID=1508375 RepID=A0A941IQK1_9ACTN|nr:cell division protein SepF [Actinospica durhamensis]
MFWNQLGGSRLTPSTLLLLPGARVRNAGIRKCSFSPKNYSSRHELSSLYHRRHRLLLDFTATSDAEFKRLIDFCAGMIFAARGTIERTAARKFTLT